MNDERRGATLDTVLLEIGHTKGIVESNAKWLKDIDDKLIVQNGRVGKLEKWKSFIFGMTSVLTLLVLPIFIRLASQWLSKVTP